MPILTCKNHPDLRWSCKDIAWENGRYNGCRNIFYMGNAQDRFTPECKCSTADLIVAPDYKPNLVGE